MSYSTVKTFVRGLKRHHDIFIRVHTKAGEEAQVDFGYVGYNLDNQGKRRKIWVFNMRLSYSRFDYYEKVYDQKVETLLEANFYEPIYQRLYLQFTYHYVFQSIPCRIYRPNDKGKVESGIKYVKTNFFKGRTFTNGDEVDRPLKGWLDKANQRIHGTTKKIPQEVFVTEEKPTLIPLPYEAFDLSKVGTRKVYRDCHVYIEHNYYSVPYAYVGKEVEFEVKPDIVCIYYQRRAIAIAVHNGLKDRGEFGTQSSNYPSCVVA